MRGARQKLEDALVLSRPRTGADRAALQRCLSRLPGALGGTASGVCAAAGGGNAVPRLAPIVRGGAATRAATAATHGLNPLDRNELLRGNWHGRQACTRVSGAAL